MQSLLELLVLLLLLQRALHALLLLLLLLLRQPYCFCAHVCFGVASRSLGGLLCCHCCYCRSSYPPHLDGVDKAHTVHKQASVQLLHCTCT
jgi:hypothetical protein